MTTLSFIRRLRKGLMEIKIDLEKHMSRCYETLSLFGIVLAVVFQSVFHLKIYQNNFFIF
jgi:hypothetical protein